MRKSFHEPFFISIREVKRKEEEERVMWKMLRLENRRTTTSNCTYLIKNQVKDQENLICISENDYSDFKGI